MIPDKRKKALCLIAPAPPPYGGIANWTENMIEMLKQCGIECELINIAPPNRALEGRTLYDRIVKSGLAMLKHRKQLKQLLQMKEIGAIHITTSGRLAFIRDIILLKTARKHHVLTVYHIHFGRIPEIIKNGGLEFRLMKKALRLASKIIVIDQNSFDAIESLKSEVDVTYIPNPIRMEMLPECRGEVREEVTFLGWGVKAKGIKELLQAWKELEKNSSWTLNIVGPYDEQYLHDILEKTEVHNVKLTGEVGHEEAMEILNGSTIFVLPSYTEGFPMSVLEAMALGKAIVATRVGAIPQMLAGECGILVDKKNVNQLKQALQYLMENEELRKKYGKNAKRKVEAEYSSFVVIEKYLKCWNI